MRAAKRAIGMVLGLTVVVLSACASPRASLGTPQGPCFQALPIAAAALGKQGSFAGVVLHRQGEPRVGLFSNPVSAVRGLRHQFSGSTATSAPGTTTATTSSTAPPARRIFCLVAYKGHFDLSKIPLARRSAVAERYAIVAVDLRARRAVAVAFVSRLSTRFHHL